MANFLPEGSTWNLFGIPEWRKHLDRLRKNIPGNIPMLPGGTGSRRDATWGPFFSGEAWKGLGEDIGLLGITEEEYFRREKDKMGPQYRGVSGQGALPGSLSGIQEGIAGRQAEESEADRLKKLSNMMMLASIAEATQADKFDPPTPRTVGTTKQPVATSIMQTYPQRRKDDDLLNYLYGGRRMA